jgi:hypothetical protein
MTGASVVVAIHVVLFAMWFGTDLATFSISRRVVAPTQPPAVRLALASAMVSVEIIARLCLPVMLGTGVYISERRGWVTWSGWLPPVVLVATICWSALVWMIHRRASNVAVNTSGIDLTTIDLGIRVSVCVLLWVVGLVSLIDGESPIPGAWLAVKVLLLATIATSGVVIRFLLRPFSAAFGSIVKDGSTPEREAQLQQSIKRAQPFVLVIWCCLVGAAFLGVTKWS